MSKQLSFQDVLKATDPKSEVLKSGKILLCKLLQMNKNFDIQKNHISFPEKFHEYITHWDTNKPSTLSMLHNNPKAEYVMFFIPEGEKPYYRYVGTYRMDGIDEKASTKEDYVFKFTEVSDFESMKGRIVIKWSDQNHFNYWHRNGERDKGILPKEVKAIDDIRSIPFTRYEDVVLSYEELHQVVDDLEWIRRLKLVNCIYAIVKKDDGQLYIGSTYNSRDGMYSRWSEYAKSGHGGDKELEKMMKSDEDKSNFQWTILEILPLKTSREAALDREDFYKQKFCSRKQLNRN